MLEASPRRCGLRRASLGIGNLWGGLSGKARPLPHAALKIVGVPLQLLESKPKRKQLLELTGRQIHKITLPKCGKFRGASVKRFLRRTEVRCFVLRRKRQSAAAKIIGKGGSNAVENRLEISAKTDWQWFSACPTYHNEVVPQPEQSAWQRGGIGCGGEAQRPFTSALFDHGLQLSDRGANAVLTTRKFRRIGPLEEARQDIGQIFCHLIEHAGSGLARQTVSALGKDKKRDNDGHCTAKRHLKQPSKR